MTTGIIAALVAAGGAGLIWLRGWLKARRLAKQAAAATARADRAELERDAAGGRAAVAEASAEVLEHHVERQEAATAVAEEIRDAAPAGLDPDERRRRLHASVRAHARGTGPVPGGGDGAAVRPPAAPDPVRDDDGR